MREPSTPKSAQEKEQEWQAASKLVHDLMREWEHAKEEGKKEKMEELQPRILAAMRAAADIHLDPGVQLTLRTNADNWEEASDEERAKQLHPILMGLGALLVTPFALAGAAVVGAGAVLWGTAKLLQGIGQGIAMGPEYVWKKFGDDDSDKSGSRPKSTWT